MNPPHNASSADPPYESSRTGHVCFPKAPRPRLRRASDKNVAVRAGAKGCDRAIECRGASTEDRPGQIVGGIETREEKRFAPSGNFRRTDADDSGTPTRNVKSAIAG